MEESAQPVALENDDFLENIDIDETIIDLTHCRLKNMAELNLERFDQLVELGLRQNLLTKIEKLPPQLEWLDVYDNKIRDIGQLPKLTNLKYLDLSYNLIKEFNPNTFDKMSNLEQIFLISNDLKEIPIFKFSKKLKNVELGSNRIREIANLEYLIGLKEIWLGKNRIKKLENIHHLVNLKILSIQSNRIHKLEGLSALTALEELYISHNGVEKIEGLECNTRLRVLDISNNRISVFENLSHLVNLEEIWANDNQLSSFAELEILSGLKNLNTVYLERNPLQTVEPTAYRRKIILTLPQVTQIDATLTKEL